EVLMLDSDHDLRNPTDFLTLDKLAKGIFHVQGISRVQAITRPDGATMDHTSIPFQLSMQNAGIAQDMKFQRDRTDDMRKQADEMGKTVATMQRMYDLMMQLAANTHRVVADTEEMQQITNDLRDRIADFDDFWRPIRSYFYWERHCYDVAICWSVRSMFDAVDGVDRIDEKLNTLLADVKGFDRLMPEMIAQLPPMIETMANMRTMMLTLHSTMSGIFNQMDDMTKHASAMGRAFDGSKNDDSFYLPPEVFENADFRRAMSNFLSPDG
ncbi:MMPL family transporter, partial [Mycobacterium montefiorense]